MKIGDANQRAGRIDDTALRSAAADLDRLREALATRILGKDLAIRQVVATLAGKGHLLIEDVPGVGKTSMALALARAIGGVFHRIQFTSDLLPSDVLGVPIYNQKDGRFEFRQGPIFANIVLADEINRTTPKTQSAMLEAMQDGCVSIDREVHDLPAPFMVIATQNPVEHHGTYPLPESQLDRFMMRIHMGYPAAEFEAAILQSRAVAADDAREPVFRLGRLEELQQTVQQVNVAEALVHYILRIAQATRDHAEIELGVSPRGSLMLYRAAQAWALCDGRGYCVPDDVKAVVHSVFDHRIMLRAGFHTTLTPRDARDGATHALDDILSRIEVPD
jgi:MoxR-like ATPase